MLKNLLLDSKLSDVQISNSGRSEGSVFYSIAKKISKSGTPDRELQNTAKRLKTRWLRGKSNGLNFDSATIISLIKNSGFAMQWPFTNPSNFFGLISKSFCPWATTEQIQSHWDMHVKEEYQKFITNSSEPKTILLSMTFDENKIFDKGGEFQENYKDFILECMAKIKPQCIIRFESRAYTCNSSLPIYIKLRCLNKNCRTFNCRIGGKGDNSLELVVKSKGEYNSEEHSRNKKRRQLRGQARVLTKTKLQHMNASRVQAEQIKDKDEQELSAGNFTGITSKSALRKARCEEKSKNDKAADDFTDMLLRHNESNYIMHVASPFTVQAMSKGQACLLAHAQVNDLYFDATGSVIRKQPNQKRVLYYTGVIGTEFGTIPLFEMATAVHTTASIKNFLTNVRSFISKEIGHWPVVKTITTDFSLAILNAFSLSWNDVDLIDYVNICFDGEHEKMIYLQLCAAHVIKMVKVKTSKCYKDWSTKNFILRAITTLITVQSFELFAHLLNSLLLLLKSQRFGKNCQAALAIIRYFFKLN